MSKTWKDGPKKGNRLSKGRRDGLPHRKGAKGKTTTLAGHPGARCARFGCGHPNASHGPNGKCSSCGCARPVHPSELVAPPPPVPVEVPAPPPTTGEVAESDPTFADVGGFDEDDSLDELLPDEGD